MRRSSIAAALGLALALIPTRAVPQDTASRYEGRWRLAATPAQARRAIDAAVDEAVGAMPFLFRSIARDRLREGTPVVRRIELAFRDDGAVVASFDGRRYETPLGRTVPRTRSSDGARLRVTQRFDADGRFEQVFEGESGTRWYVYSPVGPDRLRVQSTTDSDRMPQAMRFTLDYVRAD